MSVNQTFVIAHDQDTDEHLAQALVFNAGRLAWRMREAGVQTEQKTSISDVVTDADHAAERFVAGALAALRPEDGIVGEEGTNAASTSGRTWVVDPVDGTYNFSCGSDYWCSALALVTGDPSNPSSCISARCTAQQWVTPGSAGRVFPPPAIPSLYHSFTTAPLSHTGLGTYLHPTYLGQVEVRNAWLSVSTRCASIRMLGAGSVDLAGVAEGTLGAWMQHSVADWDWLPGRALVEGVGGTCLTIPSRRRDLACCRKRNGCFGDSARPV